MDKFDQWLVKDFTVLGVTLQNWMPIALAIVVLAYVWYRASSKN
jgi:hypothetical protein